MRFGRRRLVRGLLDGASQDKEETKKSKVWWTSITNNGETGWREKREREEEAEGDGSGFLSERAAGGTYSYR